MIPMNPFLRFHALSLALVAAALAVEPAPAVITKLNEKGEPGTSFEETFVVSESLDGIEFLVDDPKGNNKLSLKRGSYRVTYDQTKDIDFLRADRQEAEGKIEAALPFYEKAAAGNRYFWSREEGLVGVARTSLALKKPEGAIAAADQLAKDVPRSLHLDDILALKGQAQQAKGDAAGAKATYSLLVGMTKEWGDNALIQGSIGLAGLLADEKKPAEAAAVLTPVLARLDAAKNPEMYGTVGLTLAQHHVAAGKNADAIAVLSRLAYGPVSVSAEANLRWAKLLADQPATLEEAFDHAAVAATLKGAPAGVNDQARALARSIIEKLQKAPGLSEPQKLEYRKARDNL